MPVVVAIDPLVYIRVKLRIIIYVSPLIMDVWCNRNLRKTTRRLVAIAGRDRALRQVNKIRDRIGGLKIDMHTPSFDNQ